jgi:thiol-disulfide isomerase/thioredoxin
MGLRRQENPTNRTEGNDDTEQECSNYGGNESADERRSGFVKIMFRCWNKPSSGLVYVLMKRKVSIGILFVPVVLAGLIAFDAERRSAAAAESSRPSAPAWSLPDVNGKTVRSSDFKGKVVLLDFWATWCPPCRDEIPGFIELQEQYGDQGLVVVGVSLDEGGAAVVKRFMQRFKMNYPVVMGDEKVANDFGGIRGIPTTFVLDREGRIVSRHVGFAEKEVFEREIKGLL